MYVRVASWFRLLSYFSNQILVAPYLLLLCSKAAVTCKHGFITEVRGDSFSSLGHQPGHYVPPNYIKQLWPLKQLFNLSIQIRVSDTSVLLHFPSRTLTPSASVGKIWTIKWRQFPFSFYILLFLLAEGIWAILKSVIKKKKRKKSNGEHFSFLPKRP